MCRLVLVQIPSESVAVLTNADGSFQVDDLAVGFYDLTFQRAGYASQTANNQPVTNGDTKVVIRIVLIARARIQTMESGRRNW